MNRRQRAIGKRLVTLYLGDRTAEAMAEVAELRAELDAMRHTDTSPPPAELPPGTGTYVPKRATDRGRRGETEEQKQARLQANFNAQRTGLGVKLYNPEADAVRAAKRAAGKEHVSAMVRDRFNPWR